MIRRFPRLGRGGVLAIVCGAVLLALPAHAGVHVRLQARVHADLRTVTGRIEVEGIAPQALIWVDPLRRLPEPGTDRAARRTWPVAAEQGRITWRRTEGGARVFEARLPRRWGAWGRAPGEGLFVNGGWYPQPLLDGRLLGAAWSVEVELPPGRLGAVAGTAGRGTLRWRGRGQRVGLAVLERGEIRTIHAEAGRVEHLVPPGRGPGRTRRLASLLAALGPVEPSRSRLVVVEAPLYRRLVRTGPGLVFLSDHAYRLSPGLPRLHDPVVAPALLRGILDLPDAQARAFVADVTARNRLASGPSTRGLLRWFAWIPQVDEMLYDGTTPFVSDLLDEPWPGDSVRDDLAQILDPHVPGAVIARQVEALQGPDGVEEGVAAVLAGRSLQAAARSMGLDAGWRHTWDQGRPRQDYGVEVELDDPEGASVHLVREAEPGAGREPVPVHVDGERHTWWVSEAQEETTWRLAPPPERIHLDPDRLVAQQERADDRWPTRWTAVLSAFPTVWDLESGEISAFGAVRLRRQYGTRDLYDAMVFVDEVNTVGLRWMAGWTWGPLLDRRTRPRRIYGWFSPAALDPDFRPVRDGWLALQWGALFVEDTREDDLFPLHGHRVELEVDAGFVPGTDRTWLSQRGELTGVASAGTRLAVAARVEGGRAFGEVEHRLLPLGGVERLACVSPDWAVGNVRTTGRVELRAVPVRHGSFPLLFGWADAWQVDLGLEGGWLGAARFQEDAVESAENAAAVGITGGSFLVVDVLGARPTLMGIQGAWPAWRSPHGATRPGDARLYLLWWQAL